MASKSFGRLESVELRDYWQREDTHFTPWLARPENITLLGETIGLELEALAQEKAVGPFRADIIAQDARSGAQVLIENQLETTDHGHLGQLLTYACGLDAVYIVWIARTFNEEHRATLDWLNEITGEGFHFFGIEIELWRIGNSPAAPKFNLVSKPNEWTKSVKAAVAGGGPSSEVMDLWADFWAGFREWSSENAPGFDISGGGRVPFLRYLIEPANCHVFSSLVVRSDDTMVGLTMWGARTAIRYQALRARQAEIERRIGHALTWTILDGGKKAHATWHLPKKVSDRSTWPEVYAFFRDAVPTFQQVFADEIAAADAADPGDEA